MKKKEKRRDKINLPARQYNTDYAVKPLKEEKGNNRIKKKDIVMTKLSKYMKKDVKKNLLNKYVKQVSRNVKTLSNR